LRETNMPTMITRGAATAKGFGFLNGYPDPNPSQVAYTTAGTYTFVPPANVRFVSVVCVGGGSRGGAGGLGWKNNIPVIPGQSYTVFVGNYSNGGTAGTSYFISSGTVAGVGGSGNTGGGYVGDGGGYGGNGGYGGGGAGGYSGNGGVGEKGNGAGGGGGGGGYDGGTQNNGGGGGGGVGILGQGASGAGRSDGSQGGYGGSGGGNGGGGQNNQTGNGGAYGGGGGNNGPGPGNGAAGAVRIIWGKGRAFPATNTGDY
jgi:hypothetical protein